MKIKRWFVKKVIENKLVSTLCLILAIILLSVDIYYTLLLFRLTWFILLMAFISGFLLWFDAKCESHRAKLKLD
ncbi:MAG: hypothetical protein WC242_03995 [Candidatus Paceibacterota bacterium]|jgi:hypothetical protein